MNMKEFIEKSKQIDEIDIYNTNEYNYKVEWSGSDKVRQHLENTIKKLQIENYDSVPYPNSVIFSETKNIDNIIQNIIEGETYEQVYNKIINNPIIDADRTYFRKDKIKIETKGKPEAILLRERIPKLAETMNVDVRDKGSYYIILSIERLTRFEECKQYCKDKHKIDKIDEIFNIN